MPPGAETSIAGEIENSTTHTRWVSREFGEIAKPDGPKCEEQHDATAKQ